MRWLPALWRLVGDVPVPAVGGGGCKAAVPRRRPTLIISRSPATRVCLRLTHPWPDGPVSIHFHNLRSNSYADVSRRYCRDCNHPAAVTIMLAAARVLPRADQGLANDLS
jgi:hypothetical protein